MFGVTTDCPQEASPLYNGHPHSQVRGQGSGVCGSTAVEQCTFGSGCTKAASPRVFAPSKHPGVKRNRGTWWAGICRSQGPVIRIAGRRCTPHVCILNGAGTRLIVHTLRAEENRNWMHWARVPGAGPQAEHWTRSRTAPGRDCAEVCVCVPCVLCQHVAATCAGRGTGGGGYR